jgi:hypothetical protein
MQLTITTLALTLATTAHRRHAPLVGLVLLIIIAGLVYYTWRRRKLRRQRGDDSR